MMTSAPATYHPVSYRRSDEHQRDVIDHAIRVQQVSNTVAALEYLRAFNIHPDIIARVLLDPDKRRSGR